MGEVNVTISGRNYGISCQDGQEQRVRDLGSYVASRLADISKAGAANNETHLLVLTSLMLADEVFDIKENGGEVAQNVQNTEANENDEAEVVEAIDQLASRIDLIAQKIQNA